MDRHWKPIDSEWPEVKRINSYVAFMGFLAMATRGLGFLAVTWTTVVLLGGFVSMLTKKDFWCLTVITVVQIAGVLDVFLGRNLFSIGYSVWGVKAIIKVFTRNRLAGTRGSGSVLRVVAIIKLLLGWIASLFQLLAYIIILLSYISVVSGLFIAPGVSLWRLIQRDYGTADGDPSKANMTPALDVLYILVVIQGAIWVYRPVLYFYVGRTIAAEVAEEYGFKGPAVTLVREYMLQIWFGCFKDPSFARGKNLVRYAVNLMGPDKSPGEHGDGLHILSTLLGPFSHQQSEKLKGQQMLIGQLIFHGPSSTYILQHLLLASNLRSQLLPYGSEIEKEDMERATRIVAHVAYMTSLEDLPQVIQCISSLISTFGEYHQRGFRSDTDQHSDSGKEEKDYMEMLLQGLHILFELAADKNKCRVISETRGLLPKIMAPLTFDLLHEARHVAWRNVVMESLGVIRRLTAAPGETGAKLRHEISTNREAISTMTKILNCDECGEELQSLAMGILTKLDMDTKSREYFIKILVDIFTDDNRGSSSRRSAVDALAKLCFQGGSNATVILQVNGGVVDRLTTKLVASTRDNIYLTSAAAILEHLCIHYTKDDECLKKLKEAMIDVMPKVLSKILPGEATQTGGLFFSPHGDMEGQHHGASQDNGQKKSSSTWQESEELRNDRETNAAVLSLCVIVCDTFISGDQDLALQFDAIDANSLPLKLREMVTRNSDPTVSCLKIVKLTTRMLISMMRHRGTYLEKNLESLVEVLDHACRRNMFILDSSMVFASGDDDDHATTTKKPEMTLLSLIQEARELVLGYETEELEVMAPETSASGEP